MICMLVSYKLLCLFAFFELSQYVSLCSALKGKVPCKRKQGIAG